MKKFIFLMSRNIPCFNERRTKHVALIQARSGSKPHGSTISKYHHQEAIQFQAPEDAIG